MEGSRAGKEGGREREGERKRERERERERERDGRPSRLSAVHGEDGEITGALRQGARSMDKS